MTPFFSIIIPCCNVGSYVRECLDSIRNQSFRDWECIAVVEDSNDRTEAIVREIVAMDSRFRIFTQRRSGSPAAPRNTGLAHARGEYVIFVDGDDFVRENKLAELAEKIAEHPGADLYPCSIVAQMKSGEEVVWDNYLPNAPAEMTGPEAIQRIFEESPIVCDVAPMTVCRRLFLKENDLHFVYGLKWEDAEFTPRALYFARRVVPLHLPFYYYRFVSSSVSNKKNPPGHMLKHFSRLLRSLIEFYADISGKPDFDDRISGYMTSRVFSRLVGRWFYPWSIKTIPRNIRIGTLRHVMPSGVGDIRQLMKAASFSQRTAAWLVIQAARHPKQMLWLTDLFFISYFQLTGLKDSARNLFRRSCGSKRKQPSSSESVKPIGPATNPAPPDRTQNDEEQRS